jgi:hypothetical protein
VEVTLSRHVRPLFLCLKSHLHTAVMDGGMRASTKTESSLAAALSCKLRYLFKLTRECDAENVLTVAFGAHRFKNGSKFTGSWLDGERHGQGDLLLLSVHRVAIITRLTSCGGGGRDRCRHDDIL